MFEDMIYKKGMQPAPGKLEIDILLYAAQHLETEEEPAIENMLSYLPLMGLLFLLRDYLKGYRLKLRPILKI